MKAKLRFLFVSFKTKSVDQIIITLTSDREIISINHEDHDIYINYNIFEILIGNIFSLLNNEKL